MTEHGDSERRDEGRAASGEVASPCNGVCRIASESGWCEGCFRTIAEIAAWPTLDTARRRQVIARLGHRAKKGAPVFGKSDATTKI